MLCSYKYFGGNDKHEKGNISLKVIENILIFIDNISQIHRKCKKVGCQRGENMKNPHKR